MVKKASAPSLLHLANNKASSHRMANFGHTDPKRDPPVKGIQYKPGCNPKSPMSCLTQDAAYSVNMRDDDVYGIDADDDSMIQHNKLEPEEEREEAVPNVVQTNSKEQPPGQPPKLPRKVMRRFSSDAAVVATAAGTTEETAKLKRMNLSKGISLNAPSPITLDRVVLQNQSGSATKSKKYDDEGNLIETPKNDNGEPEEEGIEVDAHGIGPSLSDSPKSTKDKTKKIAFDKVRKLLNRMKPKEVKALGKYGGSKAEGGSATGSKKSNGKEGESSVAAGSKKSNKSKDTATSYKPKPKALAHAVSRIAFPPSTESVARAKAASKATPKQEASKATPKQEASKSSDSIKSNPKTLTAVTASDTAGSIKEVAKADSTPVPQQSKSSSTHASMASKKTFLSTCSPMIASKQTADEIAEEAAALAGKMIDNQKSLFISDDVDDDDEEEDDFVAQEDKFKLTADLVMSTAQSTNAPLDEEVLSEIISQVSSHRGSLQSSINKLIEAQSRSTGASYTKSKNSKSSKEGEQEQEEENPLTNEERQATSAFYQTLLSRAMKLKNNKGGEAKLSKVSSSASVTSKSISNKKVTVNGNSGSKSLKAETEAVVDPLAQDTSTPSPAAAMAARVLSTRSVDSNPVPKEIGVEKKSIEIPPSPMSVPKEVMVESKGKSTTKTETDKTKPKLFNRPRLGGDTSPQDSSQRDSVWEKLWEKWEPFRKEGKDPPQKNESSSLGETTQEKIGKVDPPESIASPSKNNPEAAAIKDDVIFVDDGAVLDEPVASRTTASREQPVYNVEDDGRYTITDMSHSRKYDSALGMQAPSDDGAGPILLVASTLESLERMKSSASREDASQSRIRSRSYSPERSPRFLGGKPIRRTDVPSTLQLPMTPIYVEDSVTMTQRLNRYNIGGGNLSVPGQLPDVILVEPPNKANKAAVNSNSNSSSTSRGLNVREKLKKKAEEMAEKHKANNQVKKDESSLTSRTKFPISEINAFHNKESISDLDNSIRNFPMVNIMSGGTIATVSELDAGLDAPKKKESLKDDDAPETEQSENLEVDKYALEEVTRLDQENETSNDENQFLLHDDLDPDVEAAALADSITEWSIQEVESEDTGAVAVEVMLSACNQTQLGQMFLKNVPLNLHKKKKDDVQTVLKRINEQGQMVVLKKPMTSKALIGSSASSEDAAEGRKQDAAESRKQSPPKEAKMVEATPRTSNIGKGQFRRDPKAAGDDDDAQKKSRMSSGDLKKGFGRKLPDAPSLHPIESEGIESGKSEESGIEVEMSNGNKIPLSALARALNAEMNSDEDDSSDGDFLSDADNFEQFISAGVNIEEILGLNRSSESKSEQPSINTNRSSATDNSNVINLVDADELADEGKTEGKQLLLEAKRLVLQSHINDAEKKDLLDTLAKFGQDRLALTPSVREELVRGLSNISDEIIPDLIDLTEMADSFGGGDPRPKQTDETVSSESEEESSSDDKESVSMEDLRQFAAQQIADRDIPKHPVKSQDSLETLMDLAAQLLRMKGDHKAQQLKNEDSLVIVQGVEVDGGGKGSTANEITGNEKIGQLTIKENHFLSNQNISRLLEQVMQHAGEDAMDTVCQTACGQTSPEKLTLTGTQKMIEDFQKELSSTTEARAASDGIRNESSSGDSSEGPLISQNEIDLRSLSTAGKIQVAATSLGVICASTGAALCSPALPLIQPTLQKSASTSKLGVDTSGVAPLLSAGDQKPPTVPRGMMRSDFSSLLKSFSSFGTMGEGVEMTHSQLDFSPMNLLKMSKSKEQPDTHRRSLDDSGDEENSIVQPPKKKLKKPIRRRPMPDDINIERRRKKVERKQPRRSASLGAKGLRQKPQPEMVMTRKPKKAPTGNPPKDAVANQNNAAVTKNDSVPGQNDVVSRDDTEVFANIMRQSQKARSGVDPDAPKCGRDGLEDESITSNLSGTHSSGSSSSSRAGSQGSNGYRSSVDGEGEEVFSENEDQSTEEETDPDNRAQAGFNEEENSMEEEDDTYDSKQGYKDQPWSKAENGDEDDDSEGIEHTYNVATADDDASNSMVESENSSTIDNFDATDLDLPQEPSGPLAEQVFGNQYSEDQSDAYQPSEAESTKRLAQQPKNLTITGLASKSAASMASKSVASMASKSVFSMKSMASSNNHLASFGDKSNNTNGSDSSGVVSVTPFLILTGSREVIDLSNEESTLSTQKTMATDPPTESARDLQRLEKLVNGGTESQDSRALQRSEAIHTDSSSNGLVDSDTVAQSTASSKAAANEIQPTNNSSMDGVNTEASNRLTTAGGSGADGSIEVFPSETAGKSFAEEDQRREQSTTNIMSSSTSMSLQHDIYSYDFKKNSILESRDTYDFKKNSILESKDTDPDGLRKNSMLTTRSEAMGSTALNIPSDVQEDCEDNVVSFQGMQSELNSFDQSRESQQISVSDADFNQPNDIVFCDGSLESDLQLRFGEDNRSIHSVASCPERHTIMEGASVDAIEHTSAPTEVFGDHNSIDQSTLASDYAESLQGTNQSGIRPAPSTGEQHILTDPNLRPSSPYDGGLSPSSMYSDQKKKLYTADTMETSSLTHQGSVRSKWSTAQHSKLQERSIMDASEMQSIKTLQPPNPPSSPDSVRRKTDQQSPASPFSERSNLSRGYTADYRSVNTSLQPPIPQTSPTSAKKGRDVEPIQSTQKPGSPRSIGQQSLKTLHPPVPNLSPTSLRKARHDEMEESVSNSTATKKSNTDEMEESVSNSTSTQMEEYGSSSTSTKDKMEESVSSLDRAPSVRTTTSSLQNDESTESNNKHPSADSWDKPKSAPNQSSQSGEQEAHDENVERQLSSRTEDRGTESGEQRADARDVEHDPSFTLSRSEDSTEKVRIFTVSEWQNIENEGMEVYLTNGAVVKSESATDSESISEHDSSDGEKPSLSKSRSEEAAFMVHTEGAVGKQNKRVDKVLGSVLEESVNKSTEITQVITSVPPKEVAQVVQSVTQNSCTVGAMLCLAPLVVAHGVTTTGMKAIEKASTPVAGNLSAKAGTSTSGTVEDMAVPNDTTSKEDGKSLSISMPAKEAKPKSAVGACLSLTNTCMGESSKKLIEAQAVNVKALEAVTVEAENTPKKPSVPQSRNMHFFEDLPERSEEDEKPAETNSNQIDPNALTREQELELLEEMRLKTVMTIGSGDSSISRCNSSFSLKSSKHKASLGVLKQPSSHDSGVADGEKVAENMGIILEDEQNRVVKADEHSTSRSAGPSLVAKTNELAASPKLAGPSLVQTDEHTVPSNIESYHVVLPSDTRLPIAEESLLSKKKKKLDPPSASTDKAGKGMPAAGKEILPMDSVKETSVSYTTSGSRANTRSTSQYLPEMTSFGSAQSGSSNVESTANSDNGDSGSMDVEDSGSLDGQRNGATSSTGSDSQGYGTTSAPSLPTVGDVSLKDRSQRTDPRVRPDPKAHSYGSKEYDGTESCNSTLPTMRDDPFIASTRSKHLATGNRKGPPQPDQAEDVPLNLKSATEQSHSKQSQKLVGANEGANRSLQSSSYSKTTRGQGIEVTVLDQVAVKERVGSVSSRGANESNVGVQQSPTGEQRDAGENDESFTAKSQVSLRPSTSDFELKDGKPENVEEKNEGAATESKLLRKKELKNEMQMATSQKKGAEKRDADGNEEVSSTKLSKTRSQSRGFEVSGNSIREASSSSDINDSKDSDDASLILSVTRSEHEVDDLMSDAYNGGSEESSTSNQSDSEKMAEEDTFERSQKIRAKESFGEGALAYSQPQQSISFGESDTMHDKPPRHDSTGEADNVTASEEYLSTIQELDGNSQSSPDARDKTNQSSDTTQSKQDFSAQTLSERHNGASNVSVSANISVSSRNSSTADRSRFPTHMSTKDLIKMYTESASVDSRKDSSYLSGKRTPRGVSEAQSSMFDSAKYSDYTGASDMYKSQSFVSGDFNDEASKTTDYTASTQGKRSHVGASSSSSLGAIQAISTIPYARSEYDAATTTGVSMANLLDTMSSSSAVTHSRPLHSAPEGLLMAGSEMKPQPIRSQNFETGTQTSMSLERNYSEAGTKSESREASIGHAYSRGKSYGSTEEVNHMASHSISHTGTSSYMPNALDSISVATNTESAKANDGILYLGSSKARTSSSTNSVDGSSYASPMNVDDLGDAAKPGNATVDLTELGDQDAATLGGASLRSIGRERHQRDERSVSSAPANMSKEEAWKKGVTSPSTSADRPIDTTLLNAAAERQILTSARSKISSNRSVQRDSASSIQRIASMGEASIQHQSSSARTQNSNVEMTLVEAMAQEILKIPSSGSDEGDSIMASGKAPHQDTASQPSIQKNESMGDAGMQASIQKKGSMAESQVSNPGSAMSKVSSQDRISLASIQRNASMGDASIHASIQKQDSTIDTNASTIDSTAFNSEVQEGLKLPSKGSDQVDLLRMPSKTSWQDNKSHASVHEQATQGTGLKLPSGGSSKSGGSIGAASRTSWQETNGQPSIHRNESMGDASVQASIQKQDSMGMSRASTVGNTLINSEAHESKKGGSISASSKASQQDRVSQARIERNESMGDASIHRSSQSQVSKDGVKPTANKKKDMDYREILENITSSSDEMNFSHHVGSSESQPIEILGSRKSTQSVASTASKRSEYSFEASRHKSDATSRRSMSERTTSSVHTGTSDAGARTASSRGGSSGDIASLGKFTVKISTQGEEKSKQSSLVRSTDERTEFVFNETASKPPPQMNSSANSTASNSFSRVERAESATWLQNSELKQAMSEAISTLPSRDSENDIANADTSSWLIISDSESAESADNRVVPQPSSFARADSIVDSVAGPRVAPQPSFGGDTYAASSIKVTETASWLKTSSGSGNSGSVASQKSSVGTKNGPSDSWVLLSDSNVVSHSDSKPHSEPSPAMATNNYNGSKAGSSYYGTQGHESGSTMPMSGSGTWSNQSHAKVSTYTPQSSYEKSVHADENSMTVPKPQQTMTSAYDTQSSLGSRTAGQEASARFHGSVSQDEESDGGSSDGSEDNTSNTEEVVNDETLRNLASGPESSNHTRDFVNQIINDEQIQQFTTSPSDEASVDGDAQMHEALSLCYSPNDDDEDDEEGDNSSSTQVTSPSNRMYTTGQPSGMSSWRSRLSNEVVSTSNATQNPSVDAEPLSPSSVYGENNKMDFASPGGLLEASGRTLSPQKIHAVEAQQDDVSAISPYKKMDFASPVDLLQTESAEFSRHNIHENGSSGENYAPATKINAEGQNIEPLTRAPLYNNNPVGNSRWNGQLPAQIDLTDSQSERNSQSDRMSASARWTSQTPEPLDIVESQSNEESTASGSDVMISDSGSSTSDETAAISELIAQFDDVTLTNENGRLRVAVLSDTASIHSNSEFFKALQDIRRQRSITSPIQSVASDDSQSDKQNKRYGAPMSPESSAHNPISVIDEQSDSQGSEDDSSYSDQDAMSSGSQRPKLRSNMSSYSYKSSVYDTQPKLPNLHRERAILSPESRASTGITDVEYDDDQPQLPFLHQNSMKSHKSSLELPSIGQHSGYSKSRMPMLRYDSGIRSVNTYTSARDERSIDVTEIQEASSSTNSVATHASQKARELRAQLDQALKTSAAIRSTQERLGAELSTFKQRLDLQRQVNNSLSPRSTTGGATSPTSSVNSSYKGVRSFNALSPSVSSVNDSFQGRRSVSLLSGSTEYDSVTDTSASRFSRRGYSESPVRDRRQISTDTARFVEEANKRRRSIDTSGLGSRSMSVGRSPSRKESLASLYSQGSHSFSYYESLSPKKKQRKDNSGSEGGSDAGTDNSSVDIILASIQQQELEEKRRKEQLQSFARASYNRIEEEAIVDLTHTRTEEREEVQRNKRRGLFF